MRSNHPMKSKKKTSSLKSSPEYLPLPKHTENPTKRRKRISDFYLADECWECVFRFIINDRSCLNSLSLVSKQLLSITNRLLFSLTVKVEIRPFLPILFKRFTNLNTLDLTNFYDNRNLDDLLSQISNFPLKLTSLILPFGCRFPADGLQAFLQNITTLKSLTCCAAVFCDMDLSPIVDCFPLLEELNLYHPRVFPNNQTNFVNTIHRLLSKSPCIEHLELRRTYFLNDQHVVDFSLFLGNLVSINLSWCVDLTETTFFSLVRNCPSLGEIKMEHTSIGKETVGHFGVYPQLKSLYLGYNSRLRDEIIGKWRGSSPEIIILFASIFPNLQLLDLKDCPKISEGICQVLRKCSKLKHLNLAFCSRVKLRGMNFEVPELEVLNLSNTEVDNETLYMISKNCCGLLQLLLENCKGVTQLREINMAGFHLRDKDAIFASILKLQC